MLDYHAEWCFALSELVLLAIVFSVPSQELGWEEHIRNDLFCAEWGIKP